MGESVWCPGLAPCRRCDRQFGVPVNAVPRGLESRYQVDVFAGGQRPKATNSPVSAGAETHVRSVDVRVPALRIPVGII